MAGANPDLINQCVHCGFCLPACPTYLLWGNEMDSPRGRIYLMKMASEGTVQIDKNWVEHMDACLGCVSCMTACPSGVDYGKLIEETRAHIEKVHSRPFFERLYRGVILGTFPRVRLLRVMRWFIGAYQSLGLPLALLPFHKLMPKLGPYEKVAEVTPAQGVKRARVGLMLGCVQREFLPEINAATARVLAAEGCEVVAPEGQGCCGALLMHAGRDHEATALTRRMIADFEAAGVDVVITNAGGCGSHLKQFSPKFKDIAEFLVELRPRAERHPIAKRVAYHDSCHLQHAQKVRTQPRELLSGIPGLKIEEIAEGAVCCGSAGIYNLVQPQAADELGDRKAGHIQALAPDAVATGNVGCILQMRAALGRRGQNSPVLHTIQILDDSIRGNSSF